MATTRRSKSYSTTTISKAGSDTKTVIVRRPASEGGTYEYQVKDKKPVKGSFKGGSNVAQERIATEKAVGTYVEPKPVTKTQVVKPIALRSSPVSNVPKLVATRKPLRDVASYNRPANIFEIQAGVRTDDRSQYGVEVNATTGGFSMPYTQVNQVRAQERIKTAVSRTTSPVVATSVKGYELTREEAQQESVVGNYKKLKSTKGSEFLDPTSGSVRTLRLTETGVYNVEGSLPRRTSLTAQEFSLIQEYGQTREAQKQRNIRTGVGLTAIGLPIIATTSPVVGLIATAGVVGTTGAPVVAAGLQKTTQVLDTARGRDIWEFKKANPEVFETARQYARQQAELESGMISGFFGTDVATTGGRKFTESGTAYLRSAGFTGTQLESGRKALARQAQIEQTAEVSTLFSAEAFGEMFGGGVIVRGGKALVSKATGEIAEKSVISLSRVAAGGAAEGSFAITSQDIRSTGKVQPLNSLLGGTIGAATAGTIELVRSNPISTKLGRAIPTTAVNLLEPQEVVVDTALNVQESVLRRVFRRGPDYTPQKLPKDVVFVEESLNRYVARPRTINIATSNTPTRSKTFTGSTLFGASSGLSLVQSRQPTRINDKNNQLIRSTTTSKTPANVLTYSFTSANVPTTALTSVLTQTPTATKTESSTKTKTKTYTSLILPPLKGGTSSYGGDFGMFSPPPKRGYSTSIAGSLWGKVYKARGLKTSSAGVISGLGVRL